MLGLSSVARGVDGWGLPVAMFAGLERVSLGIRTVIAFVRVFSISLCPAEVGVCRKAGWGFPQREQSSDYCFVVPRPRGL